MVEQLLKKEKKLAIIGLGYVGLPIALEFAKHISVIGFDINKTRIEQMRKNIDPSNELEASAFVNADIFFTSDYNDLKKASFFIVAVPTPVDDHNVPDLVPVLSAAETVGKVIKKGDYVVFESTVYPGCTEEDCVPVIEKLSGLRHKADFKVGYSPERINPGDKKHTLPNIMKVVSGCDEESADIIASVYQFVVKAGVFKASSIRVAEAAKIIENTQRDVNIALMNELSKIFDRMNINTYEVLEAAATKWNFLPFQPGLVGGHCIGVDPYYLTYKATALDYVPEIILSGRRINDNMGHYVARKTVQLIKQSNNINGHRLKVLVMGATFKENVSDIRNSKVADIINELKLFSIYVDVIDPQASSEDLMREYKFGLVDSPGKDYDAIIIAVPHNDYLNYDEDFFKQHLKPNGILVDVKGIYRKKIKNIIYWSL
jgi:UDP-N-acetyl-D-glucosamine/UDP-N-acetyl-D-galactosamine dehydrogenase